MKNKKRKTGEEIKEHKRKAKAEKVSVGVRVGVGTGVWCVVCGVVVDAGVWCGCGRRDPYGKEFERGSL
jgi:hypothetical protein